MSYFDDASLVFIPSGTKVSKAYSVKPIDGTGDLTFTRSNDTATRVASNGLIEKVRTNEIFQSETFDSATWGKSLVAITSNFDTAPNGTLTADRFVSAGGAFPQISQARTVVSGTQYTASLYVKSDGTAQIPQAFIVTGNTLSFTPTSTWQRISITFTAASSSISAVIATNSATAPASSFVIWGAQLETGDVATAYIPTTTAAVSVGPVSGLPRLDYLGSTCGKLILEPQRTNLFNFSENFDNAYWSVIGSLTITANTNVSPDGYTNADRVTTTAAPARIQRAFTGLTAGTRTLSCFVKAGTGSTFRINTFDGIVDRGATFNVATGAVTSTGTGVTATITNYGNGWYRTTHNYTSAGTSYSCQFFFDDVGTYQVYGFQFEDLVSYATSYIPTLGASVTRGADAASKTGISSLIGQTEGTLFLDFESGANDSIDYAFTLNDGTTTNRIRISRGAGNTITAQIRVAAVTQALIQTATVTPNTRFKCALAYKLDDVALYVNGAEIGVDTSSTIPACSVLATNLGDGTGLFGRPINQVLLFKTRLTNAQLAELTTI
jgi:hypothetical protein